MAKDDSNNLTNELRRLGDLLEIVSNKVNTMETFQGVTMQNVRDIRDQQSIMNQKLDAHTGSLVTIESKLDAYGDMYKINDSNIRKIQKRTELLEEDTGVEVLPELQLADVS
jgi:hypothetical protein